MEEIADLYNRLESCDICPQDCGINRFKDNDGTCTTGSKIIVASYGPHRGEEPEIIGKTASGTIFFSGCNMLCKFCQNCDISHNVHGSRVDEYKLADIMPEMQEAKYSNINLVTPTHFAPQLIKTLIRAKNNGLKIPIVHNGSSYEKVEVLKQWEGLVDIYMPDIKFFDNKKAAKYTSAPDYFNFASEAVLEMHRQVGDLIIDDGVAQKGLLIRHLILPNNQADTDKIIDFVAEKIGIQTYLNLMVQYYPYHQAERFTLLNRHITKEEYDNYVHYAKSTGFTRPEYIFSGR